MRAKRRLLISLGAIVGVLLLAVGAAFIPPVQTWVARKALSSVAGQGSSLERVSVGLNRVSVRGLRVERNGAVLVVPSADAEIEVISAGFGRGIHVKSVVVKGWTLGLAHPGQGGAPGGSESAGSWVARAVGAVLAAFNVPADLSIDGVDLEGRVILPDEGGHPMGRVRVEIAGGGLAAGATGVSCSARARPSTMPPPRFPTSRSAGRFPRPWTHRGPSPAPT